MQTARLKKRREFLRVANTGFKAVLPHVILQAALDASDGRQTRVGYTTSKKIGKAVERNRARRRLRAAFRETVATANFPQSPGLDIVCIGRHDTAACPFAELLENFAGGFKRISRNFREKTDEIDIDPAG